MTVTVGAAGPGLTMVYTCGKGRVCQHTLGAVATHEEQVTVPEGTEIRVDVRGGTFGLACWIANESGRTAFDEDSGSGTYEPACEYTAR